MKTYILPLTILLGFSINAQEYTTPNTGVNWQLSDLVAESPSTVSFDGENYIISEDITLSENDTLTFNPSESILIDEDIRLTIEGTWYSIGTENNEVNINASDSLTPYNGFRLNEDASVIIDYSIIKNGGGLKVITTDFTLTNSQLLYNVKGVATGAVVDLSYGSPLIQNNRFIQNEKPAVSSPANRTVAAEIRGNYLEGNVQLNENRPQINMGTTGEDTLKIIDNIILGDRDLDKVGGIAVSNLLGSEDGIVAIIEGNTIIDNRYGISVTGGNAYVAINSNIIEDNDTQGDPMLGGSGISLSSASDGQFVTASNNEFRRNLWGITVINKANLNLGDGEDNPGQNVFSMNMNGGQTYAIYNNTANQILAKNNCWIEGIENTLEDAASVIFDAEDDETLGEVIYDPIGCGGTVGIDESINQSLRIYPNPVQDKLIVENNKQFTNYSIITLEGKKVLSGELNQEQEIIYINLNAGVYIVEFSNEIDNLIKKLIVE